MEQHLWEYPFGPILHGATSGWGRLIAVIVFAYLGMLLGMAILFGLGPMSTSADVILDLFVLTPLGLLILVFMNLASIWGIVADLALFVAAATHIAYDRWRTESLFATAYLTGSSMIVFALDMPWSGLKAAAPMIGFTLLLATPYTLVRIWQHKRMAALEKLKASDFRTDEEIAADAEPVEFTEDDEVGYWPSAPPEPTEREDRP